MRSILPKIAAFVIGLVVSTQAFAAATILPPPETCFAATTATSGGTSGTITLLGSITGGSGYASGGSNVYANVPLTGGSGAGAIATVTVTSGVVTNVAVTNSGSHYVTTDVLSAANGNLGGSGSGFSVPVAAVQGSGTGMIGVLGTITGGSGGTTGTYANVALTGGAGSNATANITVTGGAVTQVVVVNPGAAYQVGDVLSASSGSIGGVSGFSVPVNSISINSALAGGKVYTYVPNTLTPKSTYFNTAATSNYQNPNPVPLDANGCAIIIGTGSYRFIVQDSLGNTIYDQTTTDTSTNNSYFWAGTAGGTPNAITITDAGFNATDGTQIGFTAVSTNTGASTLNPCSNPPGTCYGAIAVEKDTTAGPVSLIGGEIVQNNPVTVVYRASDNAFHILNPPIQSASGSTAPLCGASGYQAKNSGVSPNTIFNLTANAAVLISPTGVAINRSSISVAINFGVNGANGLDTGAIGASAIYYIYLIDNGAATAGLASLSSTNPTLPSGYTYSCRLSAVFTDASAHLGSLVTQGRVTTTANTGYAFLGSNAITGTCFSVFTATVLTLPPTAVAAIGELTVNTGVAGVASGTGGATITGFSTASGIFYFQAPIYTPQTLYFCNTNGSNNIYIYGWVDAVNAS